MAKLGVPQIIGPRVRVGLRLDYHNIQIEFGSLKRIIQLLAVNQKYSSSNRRNVLSILTVIGGQTYKPSENWSYPDHQSLDACSSKEKHVL